MPIDRSPERNRKMSKEEFRMFKDLIESMKRKLTPGNFRNKKTKSD